MVRAQIFLLFLLLAAAADAQRCWVENEWSSCAPFQECSTAVAAIWERKVIPPLCRVDGGSPIICCPLETNNNDREELTTPAGRDDVSEKTPTVEAPPYPPAQGGNSRPNEDKPKHVLPVAKPSPSPSFSISALKCREYSEEVFARLPHWRGHGWTKKTDTCFARRYTRVVGGLHARPKEFPHLVLIAYGDIASVPLCGGSLVSKSYVLTAAHCCHQGDWGKAKWVRVGELDTASHVDYAEPTDIPVDSCTAHPEWDSKSLYHDVALIHLQHPVRLSPFVRPACLPTPVSLEEQYAVAAGWGRIAFEGQFSTYLRKVMLQVISPEVCNTSYAHNVGMFGYIPKGLNHTTMICAAAPLGHDTCQGDSALQQLLIEPYCMYQIIGVLSFGKYCGSGHPTVYTKVSYYVPWIESVVWNSTFEYQEAR